MKKQLAFLFAALALPGAAAAQDFGTAGSDDFSLYRGSEASVNYGQVRDGTSILADGLTADSRHVFQIAPFLGAQVDGGLRWLDLEDFAFELGAHLYIMSENDLRYGVYYLPTWFEDEDDFEDDRLDNYGIEAMFNPLPPLTMEARFGRFDGAIEGPYVGLAGYYGLSTEIALKGSIEHTRRDDFLDVNFTDVLVGAEYYIPTANARVSGAVGFLSQSGDFDDTDFRLQLGATIFAFGEAATTARTRTFSRQSLPGIF